ncbi:MAG TPA: PH domain-containing protein [Methanothrix sp.]|nr:PH domain-containing protein [Methanothrix sp.]HPJ83508.1 PH domain-containing protein [Methanothrix sp.]HPR65729.1 PH domain-containing protein [Methanothrix sp.]
MAEIEAAPENLPKKIRKALEDLVRAGEVPVMALPAVPKRYQDEKAMAFARIGAFDEAKISSWIAVTDKNLIFVRSGLFRNRMDRFPLSGITGIEYVKEFQDNTLKIRIGDAAEDVRFYHETDGVRFYRHIKDVLEKRVGSEETGREG